LQERGQVERPEEGQAEIDEEVEKDAETQRPSAGTEQEAHRQQPLAGSYQQEKDAGQHRGHELARQDPQVDQLRGKRQSRRRVAKRGSALFRMRHAFHRLHL
jgi:hypothetical protein